MIGVSEYCLMQAESPSKSSLWEIRTVLAYSIYFQLEASPLLITASTGVDNLKCWSFPSQESFDDAERVLSP